MEVFSLFACEGFLDEPFLGAEGCNGVSFALERRTENTCARWSVRLFRGDDIGILFVFMAKRSLFKGAVERCTREAR